MESLKLIVRLFGNIDVSAKLLIICDSCQMLGLSAWSCENWKLQRPALSLGVQSINIRVLALLIFIHTVETCFNQLYFGLFRQLCNLIIVNMGHIITCQNVWASNMCVAFFCRILYLIVLVSNHLLVAVEPLEGYEVCVSEWLKLYWINMPHC